jgi:MFS family permease
MTDVQSAPDRTFTEEQQQKTRQWSLVVYSAIAGVILSVIWSPRLVDTVIAGNIADPVVGGTATQVAITGSFAAAVFAFITGVGGMFTACNIAVFGALAPMSAQQQEGLRSRIAAVLKPVGWLALGAVVVAGVYGAIGVLIGDSSPQLSNARIGDPNTGLRVRLLQSAIVFTVIGAIMVWYALGKLKLARNPLAGLFQRRPWTEVTFLGALVGAFLIGRPFGMFRHMYEYAVSTDNPLIGFMTFALQSLGNIAGVAILLVLVTVLTRGRFQRWLAAKSDRAARFTAAAFVIFGTFFIFYWGVRMGNRAGWYWWPTMPYS